MPTYALYLCEPKLVHLYAVTLSTVLDVSLSMKSYKDQLSQVACCFSPGVSTAIIVNQMQRIFQYLVSSAIQYMKLACLRNIIEKFGISPNHQ
jgi:hypothetical protein